MILVFTNREDAHPNPVFEALEERGVPFFRLNTEYLLTDYLLLWQADDAGCDFTIIEKESGRILRGSEITAVWDRRPEPPNSLPVTNTPEIDKHNRAEAQGFLVFLRYYLKDIPSVGSILNDRPASSKMLQYAVAHQVGFQIPNTVFSNQKNDVCALAKGYESLLLKPIESGNVWDETHEEDYVFYACKVPAKSIENIPDTAFSQTISFVQNYVEKDFELRVTVVGDKVFACKIDSQKQSDLTGKIDWRQGYEHGLAQSPFALPECVEKKCIEYLRKMGLNFG